MDMYLLSKTPLNIKCNWTTKNEAMRMERREVCRNKKYSFRALQMAHNSTSYNEDMKSMKVDKMLHMEGGQGEFSYASNSWLQRSIISKARPILEETIKDMCNKMNMPQHLSIADLGCSSGPNALEATWEAINITTSVYQSKHKALPEYEVFLNDLIGNDFNTLFRSSIAFQEKLNNKDDVKEVHKFGRCFIFGAPGSFYGRLFPSNSLHLVHASSCLHFLSQVPKDLMSKDGLALNKDAICVIKSTSKVYEAYYEQFAKDFTQFLCLRATEIKHDGQMVLTFRVRTPNDQPNYMWDFDMLGMALQTIANEGIIEEEKLHLFNVPFYTPLVEEVERLIHAEGSFTINKLDTFTVDWDPKDTNLELSVNERAKIFADSFRAATGPMVASQFGKALVHDLFQRFEEMTINHFLCNENTKLLNLVISMSKK